VKRLLVVLLLLFSLPGAASAAIRFTVGTERTQCVVGEQIIIVATIVSDRELSGLSAPPLPSSEYYSILRTSSDQRQSSSINIINGKMTQTREITYLFYYFLSLTKEGSFTIPSLELKYGNETSASAPFSITVGKEAIQTQDVAVTIYLNKKRLYAGEQAILTFDVGSKARASVNFTNESFGNAITDLEKAFGKNFSVNRLFSDKIGRSQKQINGEMYNTFTLSFSIIALKPGAYTIPSVPFEYVELKEAQRRRQDFFDDFFGGDFFGRSVQQIPKTALSNRLSIDVVDLPPQPKEFTGAVGTFTLNASVNETSAPAGEAITLTVNLSGSTRPGNLTDIKLPELADFEIFTPEKHTSVDTTAKGISTRKKFSYLIIPREEGQRTIPPIRWTYFDPGRGAYNTLSTNPITITVTKGKGGKKQQTRYLTQQDIREVGTDIRYIKTAENLRHQSLESYKNPVYYFLFPIPFIIAFFALLFRLQATVLKKDPSEVLRKKALHRAKDAAAKLQKELITTIPPNALSRVAEIIETYISHRFGFAAIGKTLDDLKQELSNLRVDQKVTDTLVPFLEHLDSLRFGGGSTDKNNLLALLKKALDLVEQLERKEKKA